MGCRVPAESGVTFDRNTHTLWKRAIMSIESKGMQDVPSQFSRQEAYGFVDAAIRSQICLTVAERDEPNSAMNGGLTEAKLVPAGGSVHAGTSLQSASTVGMKSFVQVASVRNHGKKSYGLCGKSIATMPSFEDSASASVTNKIKNQILTSSASETEKTRIMKLYKDAAPDMMATLNSSIPPIYKNAKVFADSLVAHQKDPDVKIDYTAYKSAYDAYILANNNLTFSIGPKDIRTSEIIRDGWAGAGAYYWQLISLRESTQNFISSFMPSPISFNIPEELSKGYEDAALTISNIDSALNEGSDMIENATGTVSSQIAGGRTKGALIGESSVPSFSFKGLDSVDGVGDAIGTYFSRGLAYILYTPVGGGDDDPILQARSLGNKMIGIGAVAITGYAIAKGTVKGAESMKDGALGKAVSFFTGGISSGIVGFISGVFGAISPFLAGMVFMLFGLSFIFTTVIPMLPYAIFMFAVMGYMIYVLEAMVAAPLWAVFHAAPDGSDELSTQRGAQGWMIAFSLVLRPGLIIIGFVGGMMISKVMGAFLWNTFFSAFGSSQYGAVAILTSFFAIALYGFLLGYIIYKSFDLCHELPNAVMGWIGGGQKDLGEGSGSKGFIGVGSAGAQRLEGGASQGALRAAQDGGNGDSLKRIEDKLDSGGGGGGQEGPGEKKVTPPASGGAGAGEDGKKNVV